MKKAILKLWEKITTARQCDTCGAINPPSGDDHDRLCLACAGPKGFYRIQNTDLRTSGKLTHVTLQFPIKIEWRGFWEWTLIKNRQKEAKAEKARRKSIATITAKKLNR